MSKKPKYSIQGEMFAFKLTLNKKMVNKKAVIICTVIAILVVIAIVIFNIKKMENIQYDVEEQNKISTSSNTDNSVETNIENEPIQQNTISEKEENIAEEKNQNQSEVVGKEEQNDIQNNDEKAIKLAKDQWGEDDTVYYTIDKQSGKTYYISVRSKENTTTLAEYEVDVENSVATLK